MGGSTPTRIDKSNVNLRKPFRIFIAYTCLFIDVMLGNPVPQNTWGERTFCPKKKSLVSTRHLHCLRKRVNYRCLQGLLEEQELRTAFQLSARLVGTRGLVRTGHFSIN
jgi:hypothetical protein